MPTSRGRGYQAVYYGLPMLFCLLVHWYALKMWFFSDDFAWLGLRLEVHSPRDLIPVLFSPQAQGTVRTFSERLFFLVFSSVFGLESPPFRVWVFLTQFANIALLMQITRRLTGSALASFLAPVLWSANAGLALAIGWSAAYNQIAFAFVVLLAFRLFLEYIDTGQLKFWIWQWVVFVLGFGVLEINVVYPALATGYALCCARRHVRKTLYLFIPSILFTVVHFAFIPPPTDPYYQMVFGSSLLRMLWSYWAYALGALRDVRADWRPLWLGLSTAVAITIALAVFAARMLRRREWLGIFMLGWFLVAILPVLPLKNHFTEYYITVPTIGLAILGAWAIARSSVGLGKAVAVVLAGLYLTVSIADIRVAEKYYYARSRKMKYLMKGLESLPESVRTGKTILLAGVDNDLFWIGFYDDPFRLLGIQHVYLAPGSEQTIERHPDVGPMERFIVDLDQAAPMLRHHEAVVYGLDGRRLRDLTESYSRVAAAEFAARHPGFVDVADPTFQEKLGPEWYPAEPAFRWMPKTATLKIGGPKKAGQVLEVQGFCPAVVVAKGPLQVGFRADGIAIGKAILNQPDQPFDFEFPLPSEALGRPTIEIKIEVSRTAQVPGDSRQLGLVFTTFTIK